MAINTELDQQFEAVAQLAIDQELTEMTDGYLLTADVETMTPAQLQRLEEIVGDPFYA